MSKAICSLKILSYFQFIARTFQSLFTTKCSCCTLYIINRNWSTYDSCLLLNQCQTFCISQSPRVFWSAPDQKTWALGTRLPCFKPRYASAVKPELLILVPRAHDPSALRQGSRALAGPDFLSMRRVFVSYSQPIRFARFDVKSLNRRLPVVHQPRALDPCHRPEGSWALETRMGTPKILESGNWLFQSFVSWRWPKDTLSLGTRLFENRNEHAHNPQCVSPPFLPSIW